MDHQFEFSDRIAILQHSLTALPIMPGFYIVMFLLPAGIIVLALLLAKASKD